MSAARWMQPTSFICGQTLSPRSLALVGSLSAIQWDRTESNESVPVRLLNWTQVKLICTVLVVTRFFFCCRSGSALIVPVAGTGQKNKSTKCDKLKSLKDYL